MQTSEVKEIRQSVGKHGPGASRHLISGDTVSVGSPSIMRFGRTAADEHTRPTATHTMWTHA